MIINMDLISTLQSAQSGDSNSMLVLLDQFNPLLKKYTYRLGFNFEDAKQEMILAFITVVMSLKIPDLQDVSNKTLVSYIAKSIRNSYISISKKKPSGEVLFGDISNTVDQNIFHSDDYTAVYLKELQSILTEREFNVFLSHYMHDKSIEQIAISFGVSRQSINRIKKHALEKLRNFYNCNSFVISV